MSPLPRIGCIAAIVKCIWCRIAPSCTSKYCQPCHHLQTVLHTLHQHQLPRPTKMAEEIILIFQKMHSWTHLYSIASLSEDLRCNISWGSAHREQWLPNRHRQAKVGQLQRLHRAFDHHFVLLLSVRWSPWLFVDRWPKGSQAWCRGDKSFGHAGTGRTQVYIWMSIEQGWYISDNY